ncbi:hypothetical protein CP02DC18_1003A, partial [Chlamydia psittaci 02DC18]
MRNRLMHGFIILIRRKLTRNYNFNPPLF